MLRSFRFFHCDRSSQNIKSAALLRVGLVALLCTGGGVVIDGAAATVESVSVEVAQSSLQATTIYVNPAFGADTTGAGSEASPFRTITYALQNAQPGTTIQLARGTYTQQTGEVFPLVMPPGITLRGEAAEKGQTVAIIGGGNYISPTFARQNMTIWAGKDAEIRGIAVTNPNVRGTGIWVESVNPRIEDCTFANNNREGIFISGTGNPKVKSNVFTKNGGNGLSVARNARGEIEDNIFQNTGFGLAIGGNSTPVVSGNQIIQNIDGIYINDAARPVLRGNTIANNNRDGVVVTINAQPDLGTAESQGGNRFQGNGRYDLNNATSGTIYSVGNELNSSRIAGRVELSAPIASSGVFQDVQGYWAQAYIEALAKRNIITGFPDGTFRPSDPVTRVQFAAIVNKAFSPSQRQPRIEFPDVPTTFWGYQAIQSAAQGGFMKGYPEGVFRPDQRIPRVQVLVSLANGLSFSPTNTSVLSKYQDAAAIPSYATGAVVAATQRGIVVNYPALTQLNPNREATRAEVAAFVYQALVNAGKAEPIPSPYIVLAP